MFSPHLASDSDCVVPLAELEPGERAVVVRVNHDMRDRFDRLLALGITVGAEIEVLQVFPGIVFACDQTELAVERQVAAAIYVRRR